MNMETGIFFASVMIVIALVLGAFIFIMHKAVIPTLHKRKTTGSEGMIGLKGEVIEPLSPKGVIMVGGEYWKAKSVDEDIQAGDEVEIVSLNGLTLIVKPKDQ